MEKNLIKMHLGVRIATIFTCLLFSVCNMFAQTDPCSQKTKLSGGTTINNQNKTGSTSTGYQYEIWRDGNGGSLTLYPKDACFRAEWNNAGDFLGRVGKTFNKPAWNNIGGDLVANYAYEKSGNDGGTYSYIGIYGWMDNPQIEYYIVDDWLHDRGNPGGSYMGSHKGTITVDGDQYEVWSGTRTGASKWGNSTFTQIFSIRKTRRQCGTISISEHFRQWQKLGLSLGQLMEAQILAESGGGQGYVDFTYATVEISKEGYTGGSTGGSTGGTTGGSTGGSTGGTTGGSTGGSTAVVTDPCSKTTSYSGGTKVTGNGIKDIGNGYNYEIWRDGNSGSMTYFGGDADCAFKADWNNSGDFLARVGYYDGAATKKYTDLGEITAAYNYKKSGNGGGSYSYIGIYGWTKSPLIEYYIVDDSFTPNGGGMYYNAQTIGTYQVDGVTYTLKKGTRVNAPSIEGNTTFTQVFAQRSSYQTCGTINVTEHFKNWERLGIQMGGIYDCKILCEVGGGQGSIEYTYATMSWDGQTGAAGGPAEPSEPQGPYDGAIKIPGTVEAENYDKGGNGFGYKDSDNTNEGGEYRKDGVDVVSANGGYAVGYTTSSEWLTYTVNVEKAGKYDVEAFASNGNTDIEIDLFIDDNKVGSVSGAGSEDWDTYVKLTGSVTLPAGEHILKVAFASDYNNLDYIKFYEEGTAPEEEEPSTPTTPSTPSASGSGAYFSEDGAYFGPDCGTGSEANYKGAYYTGVYPRVFQDYLGKTDAEVQGKLDQLWNHYFKGNDNSKVYYENGNEAYIYDTGNSDVRSEGMSYGMMICVQTNHRDEFDKLWSFAKNHMWHKGGQWDGYFAWQVGTNGQIKDQNCAPDGELYFMMSLLFAANRWGNNGKHNYMEDAQYILKAMWKGNNGSLFNEQHMVVTFQPYNCSDFSDPSYDLPAFVDLFARWSTTNQDKWARAATATRDHLKKSSHSSSGLYTDYNNFDGSPKYTDFNSNSHKYMYDAMRCAMNVGMDYYLFGADAKNQEDMMLRLINHFENNGYKNARFNWDGSGASESYTLGETGANAVGCFALMNDPANDSKVKTNLKKAWDAGLMTGQYRYYDGLVHYLSMLHLCGSFKIWKPAPVIEEKLVSGSGSVTYNGETYTETTTITSFEDCQLYNVTIEIEDLVGGSVGESLTEAGEYGVKLYPNPSNGNFTISTSETIESIEILNVMGQAVAVSSDANINITLSAGTYFVKVVTAEGNSYIEKMIVK